MLAVTAFLAFTLTIGRAFGRVKNDEMRLARKRVEAVATQNMRQKNPAPAAALGDHDCKDRFFIGVGFGEHVPDIVKVPADALAGNGLADFWQNEGARVLGPGRCLKLSQRKASADYGQSRSWGRLEFSLVIMGSSPLPKFSGFPRASKSSSNQAG